MGSTAPTAVAVSADGKSVYVASAGSDAVVRFNRNTTTGAISQPAGTAGCISETGAGPCADGHALDGPTLGGGQPRREERLRRLVDSDAVARFTRNTTTGAITQPAGTAGCVSETGAGPCADGHGLDGPQSVAVSPDGKSVYVASSAATPWRALTATRPPGRSPSPPGPPAASARRGRGPAPTATGSTARRSVAVSPDGKSVYVASLYSNAVARLNRNTTTGAITQPAGAAGCISETGAGPCADGHGLDGPNSVAVSPGGKSVYVASFGSNAVARLNRNTTTGAIAQPAGTAGCISETGAGPCADGHALDGRGLGGGQPRREERLRRLAFDSDAVARLNRNTTTGAITQPAGTRRLHQRDGGGALRRRPCARRRVSRWR